MEKTSHLCVSLSKESSCSIEKISLKPKALFTEGLAMERKSTVSDLQPFPVKNADTQILDSETLLNRHKDDLVVLSDDETEKELSANLVTSSDVKSREYMLDSKTLALTSDNSTSQTESLKNNAYSADASKDLLDSLLKTDKDGAGQASQKLDIDKLRDKSLDSLNTKVVDGKKKEVNSKSNINDSLSLQKVGLKSKSVESFGSKNENQGCNNVVAEATGTVLKELVCQTEDDPLESALRSLKLKQSYLAKSGPFVPKRQVIQLKSPHESRPGQSHRMEPGVKRFGPPRLDDWYRPILEIDYFAAVGLASASEDKNRVLCELKEVPVCFKSPEQYVTIFRPLVLEEFKAQLHSFFLEMSSWEDMYFGRLSVLSVERIDDFHLVRFVHDDKESVTSKSFSENDLVLLTREPPRKTSHDFHMVGKVFASYFS